MACRSASHNTAACANGTETEEAWLQPLRSLLRLGSSRGTQVINSWGSVQTAGGTGGTRRLALQTQSLSFEYHTDEWLALLKASFQSVEKAWQQCDRDWPRMRVVDNRSYLRRAKDYLGASGKPLVAFFANQACLARPFHMVMKAAGSSTLTTQYSGNDLQVILSSDGSVSLQKKFLVFNSKEPPATGKPWRTVQVQVRVDRRVARLKFTCV